MQWLTNPGDTVLDCFMGSGTTMAVCQQLGRRGIGIEKEAQYFEIARNRLGMEYQDDMQWPDGIEACRAEARSPQFKPAQGGLFA